MALIGVPKGRLHLSNITNIIKGIASPTEYIECLILIGLAKRTSVFDVEPLPYTSLVIEMAAFGPAIGKIIQADCAILLLGRIPHALLGRQPLLMNVYWLHLKTIEGSIGLWILLIIVIFLGSSSEAGIALGYKYGNALVHQ